MKTNKTKPVVVEEEIDEEVDELIDQLEEEDIDEEVEDEEDEEEVAPKKVKPAKAAKEPKEKKAPVVKDPNEVTAGMLADQLQADPRELRMFLRANFTRPDDAKNSKWSWKKGDPQLQVIIDAYKAKKSAPKVEKQKVEVDQPKVKVVK